ncbi:trans-2-decenoyl-ACP isomerase [Streptococcus halichoeri]|uniref:trans-2-decenoyl-ACP isomerase n=1 Tax=Streptococcus halichoeri TaxID=254785 RepID=UPI001C8CF5CB|nr:enoyl-CoA hydratase [Streptococcus halichoeri]
MTNDYITLAFQEDVATLTLNQPERSNGFNVPMCQAFLAALETVKETANCRFLVIRAKGKLFSIGGDLATMQEAIDQDDISSLVTIAELVQEMSFAIKHLPLPVIVCTHGAVAGAAFNLALAADFCLAAEGSRFIQAFVNVGLAPDAGGLFLLARAVGLNKALQLAMTGDAVTAEQAKELGFVYQTFPPADMDRALDRLLKKLRRGSSHSYRAIKQLIWQSLFTHWEAYGKEELQQQTSLAFQPDFREGVQAFTERRRPRFTSLL